MKKTCPTLTTKKKFDAKKFILVVIVVISGLVFLVTLREHSHKFNNMSDHEHLLQAKQSISEYESAKDSSCLEKAEDHLEAIKTGAVEYDEAQRLKSSIKSSIEAEKIAKEQGESSQHLLQTKQNIADIKRANKNWSDQEFYDLIYEAEDHLKAIKIGAVEYDEAQRLKEEVKTYEGAWRDQKRTEFCNNRQRIFDKKNISANVQTENAILEIRCGVGALAGVRTQINKMFGQIKKLGFILLYLNSPDIGIREYYIQDRDSLY